MSTVKDPEAVNLAIQGELLRSQGNFSNAVAAFDAAIAKDPSYPWAFAHRGAAKAALQDLNGFEQDFQRALDLKKPDDYPWVHAQWGEAYRIYARDHLWSPGPDAGGGVTINGLVPHWLQTSVSEFNKAIRIHPNNAWTLAHRGAIGSLQYFLSEYIQRNGTDQSQPYADRAMADFNRAIELNPVYSWAYVFKCVLLTLMRSHDDARTTLASGLLYDVNHRLIVLRSLSMLYNYERDYQNSIIAGWQALQANPDDYLARYFVSVGMASTGSIGGASVASTVAQTQNYLNNVKTLVTALLGGLALIQGDEKGAQDALEYLQKNPDVETYAIVNLDSTWDAWRSDPVRKALFQPHT